jgi:DNA helicase-2/ATP-dependent DNA helicase PcrA
MRDAELGKRAANLGQLRLIMVVGDDAQAIYSFRAATVRNILGFPNAFEPQARIITLEQNYRSRQPILDASNAVMGLAKESVPKTCGRTAGPSKSHS